MPTSTLKADTATPPTRRSGVERSSLTWLYLIRGVLAVAWALLFARVNDHLDALTIALLVAYPLIDAVSSLIDYRAIPAGRERRVTAFNAQLSTVAAIAMGAAGGKGAALALLVFGAWAIISGAAQFLLGLRRRGAELGRQWPMLIAGGLSFLVGISYAIRATADQPSLDALSVYATGGGVFFIIQSALLAWRTRQRRAATA